VEARKQLPLPKGVRVTGTAAASPDGRRLAYVDDSGTIHVVNANDGTEQSTLNLPGTTYTQVVFSPENNRLAGGGTSGDQVHVAVWNLSDGKLLHRWDWPKGRDPHSMVESLCFTPDGKRLAAAVFRQSAAYIWDLTTDQRIVQLSHSSVYGLSFSPDGKTLVTAGWDKTIRFWQTDTGKKLREHKVAADPGRKNDDLRMYMVCYSPNGRLIATAHLLYGTVRIWNANDMTLKTQFRVPGGFTYGAMTFSPDGLWLATGSRRGGVSVWDPVSAQKVWDTGKHQGYVYTVGFGRDSRTLLSGGKDGACYLWDLRPRAKQPDIDPTRLWSDLVGKDGLAAYQAMWAFSKIFVSSTMCDQASFPETTS